MSMSSWVYGFKPPDEKWKKMKALYEACEAASIVVPNEVEKFFEGEPPDNAGVKVSLRDTACCQEHRAEMEDGYEINLTKLPKDIKIIRFVNSY